MAELRPTHDDQHSAHTADEIGRIESQPQLSQNIRPREFPAQPGTQQAGMKQQAGKQQSSAQGGPQAPSVRKAVEGAGESLKKQAGEVKHQAADAAHEAMDAARQTVGEAAVNLRAQGADMAIRQKERAGEELSHLGAALRSAAEKLHDDNDHNIATYAEAAAEKVQGCADYLRQSDLGQLVDDVEQFARRRPELFYGGLFLAGLGISRFLKASRHHHYS